MQHIAYHRHVHIVDKIDQLFRSRRTIISTSFLLQWFVQHSLQHSGRCVIVERNIGDHKIIGVHCREFVANQHGFTCACAAYQHDRSAVHHQKIHEVAHSNGFLCVYEHGLETRKTAS